MQKCRCLLVERQEKVTSRLAFAFHTLHSCPPRTTSSPPASHAFPAVRAPRAKSICHGDRARRSAEDSVVWAYDAPRWCATRPRRPVGCSSAPHRRTPQRQWRLRARPARRCSTLLRCRPGLRPGVCMRSSRGGFLGCLPPPPRPPTQLSPPLAAAAATAAGATATDDPAVIATAAVANSLHHMRQGGAAAAADGRRGGAVAKQESFRDGRGRSGLSRRGPRWPFPPFRGHCCERQHRQQPRRFIESLSDEQM